MISESCAATWRSPVVQNHSKNGASLKPRACLNSHNTKKPQPYSVNEKSTNSNKSLSTRHILKAYSSPSRSNSGIPLSTPPAPSSLLSPPPPPSSQVGSDEPTSEAAPGYTSSKPAGQPLGCLPPLGWLSSLTQLPSLVQVSSLRHLLSMGWLSSLALPLLLGLMHCLFLAPVRPALAQTEGILVNTALHSAQSTAQTASASAAAAPLVLGDIGRNSIFMASLVAWALAQSLKVVTKFWAERVLDWRMLFASGGMPSSHSSMCCALTASTAILFGFSSPLFPITLAFTLIVMYDATSVRYHAGVQAQVLNVVVKEMLQGHPVSEQKLKEILGHTPLQVAGGALLGIAVSYLYHRSLGFI